MVLKEIANMNNGMETVRGLRFKLRIMGIPIGGPAKSPLERLVTGSSHNVVDQGLIQMRLFSKTEMPSS